MEFKSFLLATALTLGATAQTTPVMGLFLDSAEDLNASFVGSVVSAAPEATTYLVRRLDDANCTEEKWKWVQCDYGDPSGMTRLYVNGPSTFARHYTEPGEITSIVDTECNISGDWFYCGMTWFGPSTLRRVYTTVFSIGETASSLHQVTITAGLEKILAVVTTTSSVSAQTAASASSGPSETFVSATATSSSSSASTPSTTQSGAEAGAFRNLSLAAFCGLIVLVLGL